MSMKKSKTCHIAKYKGKLRKYFYVTNATPASCQGYVLHVTKTKRARNVNPAGQKSFAKVVSKTKQNIIHWSVVKKLGSKKKKRGL